MRRKTGARVKLLGCFFYMILSTGVAGAAATYSESTGGLTIPLLDVPGIGALTLEMRAAGGEKTAFGADIDFVLSALDAAPLSNELPATISLETLRLHVPLLWVTDGAGNSRLYTVDLTPVPDTEPLRFRTIDVQPFDSKGLMGPQGLRGEKGPVGPEGPQGEAGAVGSQGSPGTPRGKGGYGSARSAMETVHHRAGRALMGIFTSTSAPTRSTAPRTAVFGAAAQVSSAPQVPAHRFSNSPLPI